MDKQEKALKILNRDNWTCQSCGCRVNTFTAQLAHGIPQRKHLIKKYGKEIIHHTDNLKTACSLRCNAKLQASPYEWEEIAYKIAEKEE